MDRLWYLDVNGFARETPWAHAAVAAYALWAGLTVLSLLLVAGYWLVARHQVRPTRAVATAFCTGLGTIVALEANHKIAALVARPRPCHALHHVEVLLACNSDYTFPSDHCVVAGAFAAGLLLLDRRLGIAATVLALLLAFARVYVGVHYPSDAAAGLVIGAAIGLIVIVVVRPAAAAGARWLARTRLRPLVTATY